MNLHHCPYTGYESPAGEKEREGEGEWEKGSSHSAGHDLKDFALKIPSVVNISPRRTTLKPLHSCFCTAVPTVSQRLQKGIFLPREGESSVDLWKSPRFRQLPHRYVQVPEGRSEENSFFPFSCRTAIVSRKAE